MAHSKHPLRQRVCATLLGFIILAAIVIFITWLVLHPHRPRYSVDYGAVSELSVSGNVLNTRMTFNVTSRNRNKRIGIFYDKMEGYVHYGDQRIAGAYIAPFYQGHKKTTIIRPILTGHYVLLKKDIARDLELEHSSGALELRLKLYAKIRFKVGSWKSGHYHMKVKCPVWVELGRDSAPFSPTGCKVLL